MAEITDEDYERRCAEECADLRQCRMFVTRAIPGAWLPACAALQAAPSPPSRLWRSLLISEHFNRPKQPFVGELTEIPFSLTTSFATMIWDGDY